MYLFLSIRLLDWRERRADGPKRMKNERIIVFKHLFDPKEFEVREGYGNSCLSIYNSYECVIYQLKEDPTVLNDIRDDLRQECEKFGTVKKIMIFDVCKLTFTTLTILHSFVYHKSVVTSAG